MSVLGRRGDAMLFEARLAALAIGSWPARRWFVAVAATTATALAMGIPTGVVPTSLYHRMTPVTWWDRV